MKTSLEFVIQNNDVHEFRVHFKNEADHQSPFPIGRMELAAERVGFVLEEKGKALEPLEFNVINPREPLRVIDVMPGETVTIRLPAQLKKLGKTAWGLVFKNATYRVLPETKYLVSFSLDGYSTEKTEWRFSEEE